MQSTPQYKTKHYLISNWHLKNVSYHIRLTVTWGLEWCCSTIQIQVILWYITKIFSTHIPCIHCASSIHTKPTFYFVMSDNRHLLCTRLILPLVVGYYRCWRIYLLVSALLKRIFKFVIVGNTNRRCNHYIYTPIDILLLFMHGWWCLFHNGRYCLVHFCHICNLNN